MTNYQGEATEAGMHIGPPAPLLPKRAAATVESARLALLLPCHQKPWTVAATRGLARLLAVRSVSGGLGQHALASGHTAQAGHVLIPRMRDEHEGPRAAASERPVPLRGPFSWTEQQIQDNDDGDQANCNGRRQHSWEHNPDEGSNRSSEDNKSRRQLPALR
jgi:hypothetical protein